MALSEMSAKPRYDIGVIVPLAEELQYVIEVAPIVRSINLGGAHFHVLDFGRFTAIACLVGEMGLLAAQHATRGLLDYADVKLLVLLGTAGALDDDLSVGDVAIATEINEYLANSRAETTDDRFEFRYSGRHWPLEYRIRQLLPNFEFADRRAYETWQDGAARLYAGLEVPGKSDVCMPPPSVHRGSIASGNVVVASKVFAAEVKKVDRKFIAVDMEAAGFAFAASERIHPVPHLVVRGISDGGDENKKKLDKTSKNAWRRYCVRNATSLLQALLSWDSFVEATGLAATAAGAAQQNAVRNLIGKLRGCPGGPWAAGLALGIYSHGPAVAVSGNAVPQDVTRLRLSDPRFQTLMEVVEAQATTSAGIDIGSAAAAITRAVALYRDVLASEAANALIGDFDQVVLEIVFPETDADDAGTQLLLQADRLAEDEGLQSVVILLKDQIETSPRVRERYVDTLSELGDVSSIVDLARSVGSTQLTRLELEHAMCACGQMGREDLAEQMWVRHVAEFEDSAALLFRREVVRKFPALRTVWK